MSAGSGRPPALRESITQHDRSGDKTLMVAGPENDVGICMKRVLWPVVLLSRGVRYRSEGMSTCW